MNAELHPITRSALTALAACTEPAAGLPTEAFRSLADVVVQAKGAEKAGAELIALGRRMVEAGLLAFAEQLVVLAGLAMGDTAAAKVHRMAQSDAKEAIRKLTSPRPPGTVRGGPLVQGLARTAFEPEASKCPVTRFTRKLGFGARPAR